VLNDQLSNNSKDHAWDVYDPDQDNDPKK